MVPAGPWIDTVAEGAVDYLFLCRMRLLSFLYLCFRIFFRRFLTTLPIRIDPPGKKLKNIFIIEKYGLSSKESTILRFSLFLWKEAEFPGGRREET
jgi:hypothetical protein